jgi:hypothetical protein
MMNIHEHLLTCLAEESGEIAQAAHKALRFGIDDGYPGTERTNRRDIVQEVNDLIGGAGVAAREWYSTLFSGIPDSEMIVGAALASPSK